jgi:hypothetical protein
LALVLGVELKKRIAIRLSLISHDDLTAFLTARNQQGQDFRAARAMAAGDREGERGKRRELGKD